MPEGLTWFEWGFGSNELMGFHDLKVGVEGECWVGMMMRKNCYLGSGKVREKERKWRKIFWSFRRFFAL